MKTYSKNELPEVGDVIIWNSGSKCLITKILPPTYSRGRVIAKCIGDGVLNSAVRIGLVTTIFVDRCKFIRHDDQEQIGMFQELWWEV